MEESPYVLYRLCKWVDEKCIDWAEMSRNPSPGAVALLKKNPTNIHFSMLCLNTNPDAIDMLDPKAGKEMHENCECCFRLNQAAINWRMLSLNSSPKAVSMIVDAIASDINHPLRYNVRGLVVNPNPRAGELLADYLREKKWSSNRSKQKFYKCSIRCLCASESSAVMDIVAELPDNLIDWVALSLNSCDKAIEILQANPERINWHAMAKNPATKAFAMFLEHFDIEIQTNRLPGYLCEALSANTNPNILAFVDINRIGHWARLSSNPAAGKILLENQSKIVWIKLSQNNSDIAMDLLDSHPENIDMFELSQNRHPRAPELIVRHCMASKHPVGNPEGIRRTGNTVQFPQLWTWIWNNSGIFEKCYDYAAIRARMDILREDLAKAAFHPHRLERYIKAGGDPDNW